MPTTLSAPPLQTPVIESLKELTITKVWGTWLRSLVDRAQTSAYQIKAITVTGQNASIAATDLEPLASGLYRVSYRFRVTTAAGVSSSLSVTITTTDGGITVTYPSAAYTGNVTNAPQTGSFVVRADPSSPISYSTTYASNAAGAMVYALDVVLEQL